MSKFFKALEQAERDRSLREVQQEVSPTGLPPRPPTGLGEDLAPAKTAVSAETSPVPPGIPTAHYRSLACAIQRFVAKGIRKLLVTSSGPEEGKSTIIANLGRTLAQSGKERVVLIDTDRVRPTLHKIFGVGNPPGLGEILTEVSQVKLCNENHDRFGLGDWVELLRIQARTGRLLVSQDAERFCIYFLKGKVSRISWEHRPEDTRLGSLLVRAGRITEVQKAAALRLQQEGHRPLGDLLCALGNIAPTDLRGPLQSQLKDSLVRISRIRYPVCRFSEDFDAHLPPFGGVEPDTGNGADLSDFSLSPLTSETNQPFLSRQISRHLKDTGLINLKILTSGVAPYDLQDRFIAEQFKILLDQLGRRFDLVLIDSPPVGPASPATTLATLAEGVLLVVRSDGLDARIIQQAKQQLDQHNANILGVILNRVDLASNEYLSSYGAHK